MNLSYNIADTHGWGKYFETATFDKSRAYFGGSLRPSSVVFDPMTLNIEKKKYRETIKTVWLNNCLLL
ncbi:hypothetical protein FA707_03110 [Vagococcus zengguangii]|uniref:Uncharacterized protein n=1 Tax=Vagococcus zengguangii TaxID=2571750 RepID=A0A4D7CUK7_9ENTE|nr:hypothetical protein FA707_03110 [Vagococcus zengguangii]